MMNLTEQSFAKLTRASVDPRLLNDKEIIDISIMQNEVKSSLVDFSMVLIGNSILWRTLLPKIGLRIPRKSIISDNLKKVRDWQLTF